MFVWQAYSENLHKPQANVHESKQFFDGLGFLGIPASQRLVLSLATEMDIITTRIYFQLPFCFSSHWQSALLMRLSGDLRH